MRLVLSIAICCVCLSAATKYVATTGNDSTGDGSIGNPWLTIRNGLLTISPGDTLNIRAGTYPDDGHLLREFPSGTATNLPTTVQAYNGEAVTYYPQVAGEYGAHAILFSGKSNVVLNGFSVNATGCTSDGIKLTDSSIWITLTNMTIYGCGHGMGVLTTGPSEGVFMNSTITHCNVITNGWNASTNDPPLHQIYLQTSGMTVDHCYIQGSTNVGGATMGIQYFGTGCTNGYFYNNLITNCSNGILAGATRGSNCYIYNNLITENRSWGVSVYKMDHVYVLNNTCYTNNAQIGIDTATNVWCENNIGVGGYNNNPSGFYITGSDTVFLRNNLAYGNYSGGSRTYDYRLNSCVNLTTNANMFAVTTTYTNEIYNAKFDNAPNGVFTISDPTSSAVGGGLTETLFMTDYLGKARPEGGWTIGAYEWLGYPFIRVVP